MAKPEKTSIKTLHVVQPFERTGKGKEQVRPAQAYQANDAGSAIRKAQRLNDKIVGAVAFSRTGDIKTGEFADAVILGIYGTIPEEALDAIREGVA